MKSLKVYKLKNELKKQDQIKKAKLTTKQENKRMRKKGIKRKRIEGVRTQGIGKRNKEDQKQNQKNCLQTVIKKYKVNVRIKFKILIEYVSEKISKPCRFFLQGFCRNGYNCQFAHQEVVTERDGNMSRTFVNTDKYDYRRNIDVRQRYIHKGFNRNIYKSQTERVFHGSI